MADTNTVVGTCSFEYKQLLAVDEEPQGTPILPVDEELESNEQASVQSEESPTIGLDSCKSLASDVSAEGLTKVLFPTHESIRDSCWKETRRLSRRMDHVEKMLHHHARETWQLRNFMRAYVARDSTPDMKDGSEPVPEPPAGACDGKDGCIDRETADDWAQVRRELLADVYSESLKENSWQLEVGGIFAEQAAKIRAEMSLDLADHYTQVSQEFVEKMHQITDASCKKLSDLVTHSMRGISAHAKGHSMPQAFEQDSVLQLPSHLPSKPSRGMHENELIGGTCRALISGTCSTLVSSSRQHHRSRALGMSKIPENHAESSDTRYVNPCGALGMSKIPEHHAESSDLPSEAGSSGVTLLEAGGSDIACKAEPLLESSGFSSTAGSSEVPFEDIWRENSLKADGSDVPSEAAPCFVRVQIHRMTNSKGLGHADLNDVASELALGEHYSPRMKWAMSHEL